MGHKESAARVWGKRPIIIIMLAFFALTSTAIAEETGDQGPKNNNVTCTNKTETEQESGSETESDPLSILPKETGYILVVSLLIIIIFLLTSIAWILFQISKNMSSYLNVNNILDSVLSFIGVYGITGIAGVSILFLLFILFKIPKSEDGSSLISVYASSIILAIVFMMLIYVNSIQNKKTNAVVVIVRTIAGTFLLGFTFLVLVLNNNISNDGLIIMCVYAVLFVFVFIMWYIFENKYVNG
ncbi:MAG: membrane protein of unknown function [Methanothrix sp.]|jgi:hypothetical protein|nr:MAG: membrane protein of unknown function [Methanothrix sp.]